MKKDDYIITGATALFRLGYITFDPSYIAIEKEYGTKVDNYKEIYLISTQSKDTINLGVMELNGERIYSPERLYIELNKFPLENTIRTQAIKNLENVIEPEIVKKYYDKLKTKRRKLNKIGIEKFLEKHLMNVKEVFSEKKFNPNQVLREYLMALLSRKNIPLVIIKGGSAVELFIKNKRATQDLDLHSDKNDVANILEYLQDTKKLIFFKFNEVDEFIANLNDSLEKRIYKITAVPKTNLKIENFEILKGIELTFNTSYSASELKQFIVDYKIIKKNLKIFSNAYALVFTKEMLIAEKYQSLISEPEQSTRTKDLIDLANLVDEDTKWDEVYHWLLLKWANIRDNKNPVSIKKIIETNKEKELLKISPNFSDACKMYQTSLSYADCYAVYNKISNIILSKLKSDS